jgi:hypothetical protein
MPISHEEQLRRLKELYPNIPGEQIVEAQLHLEGYLKAVIRIFERIERERGQKVDREPDQFLK